MWIIDEDVLMWITDEDVADAAISIHAIKSAGIIGPILIGRLPWGMEGSG